MCDQRAGCFSDRAERCGGREGGAGPLQPVPGPARGVQGEPAAPTGNTTRAPRPTPPLQSLPATCPTQPQSPPALRQLHSRPRHYTRLFRESYCDISKAVDLFIQLPLLILRGYEDGANRFAVVQLRKESIA